MVPTRWRQQSTYGLGPYFEGRERELGALRDIADIAIETGRSSIGLIQGAPGSGKTALALEFARRAPDMTAFRIQPEQLFMSSEVPRMQVYGLSIPLPPAMTDLFGQRVRAKITATDTAPLDPRFQFGTLHHRLRITRTGPLLIVIDEIQRLEAYTDEAGLRTTLEAIRNATIPHPVMVLMAGLGHSLEVLVDCGLSRLDTEHILATTALGVAESARMLEKGLIHMGFDPQGDEDMLKLWVQVLTEDSQAWPAHLTAALNGAGEALEPWAAREQDMDSNVLHQALRQARENARRRRDGYYAQRARNLGRRERCMIGDVLDKLARDGRDSEDPEWFVAELRHAGVVDPPGLLDRIIRAGVLTPEPTGLLSAPIPSFTGWLREQGRETPARSTVGVH